MAAPFDHDSAARRRSRALGLTCPTCGRPWALQAATATGGWPARCRYCQTLREDRRQRVTGR